VACTSQHTTSTHDTKILPVHQGEVPFYVTVRQIDYVIELGDPGLVTTLHSSHETYGWTALTDEIAQRYNRGKRRSRMED